MKKNIAKLLLALFVLSFGFVFTSTPKSASAQTQSGCDASEDNDFLGFPKWYKYLGQQEVKDEVSGATICNAKLNGIQDIWLVVAAVIELLLRVSAMIAIGFIIFGGVSYVISQGAPDKTKKAQSTIMNAVIGLVISIVATASVSFFAGRF